MTPKNIFAWTAEGCDFPAYVSVNETALGGFEIIVRSPKEFGGAVAQVRMDKELFEKMAFALFNHDGCCEP